MARREEFGLTVFEQLKEETFSRNRLNKERSDVLGLSDVYKMTFLLCEPLIYFVYLHPP